MQNLIPKSIFDLHKLFKDNGKQLFIVGGCVRDFLLKQTPKDWDLATDATPDQVLLITNKYKNHLHGKSFGVVVVYTEDEQKGFEIATFREDVYGDKLGITRNPDVIFSTIEKDVQRRDTTINALFYDMDKNEVVDLVGGINDIENNIIRFVGEPELRIIEDPIRIMRFIRIGLRFHLDFDEASSNAILKKVNTLSIISRERIFEEIEKAFEQVPNINVYMKHLIDYGIAEAVYNIDINKDYSDRWFFTSLEMSFAQLFLGNLTKGLQKKMIQEFKMTKEFSRKVVFFLDTLNVKAETALDLYDKKNVTGTKNHEIDYWFRFIEFFRQEDLPASVKAFLSFEPSVKARDLMELGFSENSLGKEIKRLEVENYNRLSDLYGRIYFISKDFEDFTEADIILRGDKSEEGIEYFNMTNEMYNGNGLSRYDLDESILLPATYHEVKKVADYFRTKQKLTLNSHL